MQQLLLSMHCAPGGQSPHCSAPPQPSLSVPQMAARSLQVVGVQTPQTFAVPLPPQVSPGVLQSPQSSAPPHPFGIVPQLFAAHVMGVQTPQMFGSPPPPQVSPGAVQTPQSSWPPHLSEMEPHSAVSQSVNLL